VQFGYLSLNHAGGINPARLARELEDRGFESLWVPEHSHIPVDSPGTFPDPSRAMPDGYAHMMNPFISLMAAASSTSELVLGTGMSVGLEHDLLDLACTAATLDVLSDSRLILGLGVGWNSQELQNHRPGVPFKKRYAALKERVAALRAAWSSEHSSASYDGLYADADWGKMIASFAGEYDNFTPSWVFPKPGRGTIPVALGLAGPLGMQHAASYADIWGPVDSALMYEGKADVSGRIKHFRRLVAEAGRNPDEVKITLFNISGVTDAMVDHYASLEIERFVFGPATFMRHPAAETLKHLDGLQKFIEN
jgi:alkanesulfonate monooxygenase SsuD/methylene tetrahydromethanopterin reductase-like flavin-dependent oxidoreductase (luciferase family)